MCLMNYIEKRYSRDRTAGQGRARTAQADNRSGDRLAETSSVGTFWSTTFSVTSQLAVRAANRPAVSPSLRTQSTTIARGASTRRCSSLSGLRACGLLQIHARRFAPAREWRRRIRARPQNAPIASNRVARPLSPVPDHAVSQPTPPRDVAAQLRDLTDKPSNRAAELFTRNQHRRVEHRSFITHRIQRCR